MTSILPRWFRKFFRDEQHWDDLAFFREVTLFHGMNSWQLGRIKQAMQKRTYRAGEVLFKEGQIGQAVFIIKSARVELTRTSGEGARVLGALGPGHIFGEMALLEQMPRTATATVAEDGVIYLFYTATLDTLIRHHPAVGVKLMKNMAIFLSALLRKTNKELDQVARQGQG